MSAAAKTLSPSPSAAAERLEIIESERHMMSATSSLSRPSDLTRARFQAWSVLEENRQVGDMLRTEADERRQQRTAAKLAFREKGNANARAAKAQREAAALRVRQHWDENAHRGHECKEAVSVAVDELHHIQEEWVRHGTENRMRYGVEQKEKVHNNLAERHATNLASATDLKAQEAARHAAQVAARKASLEQKRERVRQIREQTHPDVNAKAKEFFYSQRKATADQVPTPSASSGGARPERRLPDSLTLRVERPLWPGSRRRIELVERQAGRQGFGAQCRQNEPRRGVRDAHARE